MSAGPAEVATAAVECTDLVVRYGDVTAVDHLSLTARPGEVVAILGPNGAGKTSTVETLMGYRVAASGTLSVLNLHPRRDHRALVRHMGVMLQRGGVYPMLSPRRALGLFAAYYPQPEDPEALLDLVSLRPVARTPWRHLSGGEQQRLSLALALIGRPEVLFLDEPTAGVDPEGRLGVRAVVRGLRERGACILLTTHELAEAEQLADRVVIISKGKVLAAGTPGELAAGLAGVAPAGGAGRAPGVSFGAPPGLDTGSLGAAVGAAVSEVRPGRYQVSAPATPALTAALATWLAQRDAVLTDLRTGRSLEEAYLSIVAGEPPVDGGTGTGRGRRGRGRGERGQGDGRPSSRRRPQ